MRLIDGRYLRLVFAYVMACKVILWWAIRADFLYAFRKSSRLHERKRWLLYIFFGFKLVSECFRKCIKFASTLLHVFSNCSNVLSKVVQIYFTMALKLLQQLLRNCFMVASNVLQSSTTNASNLLYNIFSFQNCFKGVSECVQNSFNMAPRLLQSCFKTSAVSAKEGLQKDVFRPFISYFGSNSMHKYLAQTVHFLLLV